MTEHKNRVGGIARRARVGRVSPPRGVEGFFVTEKELKAPLHIITLYVPPVL